MTNDLQRVNIHDVARSARISTATMSKVINRRHGVAQATSQRLQRVIDELELASPKWGTDPHLALRLPEEDQELRYEDFRAACKRVRRQIYVLKNENKIYHATHLKGNIDLVIRHGLDNVGIFHLKLPLLMNKEGNIITKDFSTLYYYHNRLAGYDLEKFV